MTLTLEEANSLFQRYCDEHSKLFLPGANDAAIVANLSEFYSKHFSIDLLKKSIKYYVKTSDEPVLIYNFALESGKIREYVLREQKISEDFDDLLDQTKRRMEQIRKDGGR